MGNVDYEYYSKKLKIKNLKSKTNYILFVSEKIKGSTQKISREYKVDEFETINRILNVFCFHFYDDFSYKSKVNSLLILLLLTF